MAEKLKAGPGVTLVITADEELGCGGAAHLVKQGSLLGEVGALVIGESRTFTGGHDWLAEHGVTVTLLDDERCVAMMEEFIAERPDLWAEDIGE